MENKTIQEKINEIALKFSLSKEAKEAILQLSKDSYIQGSNDCHKSLIDEK